MMDQHTLEASSMHLFLKEGVSTKKKKKQQQQQENGKLHAQEHSVSLPRLNYHRPTSKTVKLYGVAAKMLDLKKGGSRCEQITLLPPGPNFLVVGLISFGMEPPSGVSLSKSDYSLRFRRRVHLAQQRRERQRRKELCEAEGALNMGSFHFAASVDAPPTVEDLKHFSDRCDRVGEALCFQPRLTCKLVRFLGHGQSTDPSNRSALSSSLDYAVLAGFGRGSPVSNSATVGSEESYESNDDEELFNGDFDFNSYHENESDLDNWEDLAGFESDEYVQMGRRDEILDTEGSDFKSQSSFVELEASMGATAIPFAPPPGALPLPGASSKLPTKQPSPLLPAPSPTLPLQQQQSRRRRTSRRRAGSSITGNYLFDEDSSDMDNNDSDFDEYAR